MRALSLVVMVVACSSSKEDKPQPTTPCGQAIAVVGGAIEATLAHPDAKAFHMAAELAPAKDCAGIAELVRGWEAYLGAPDPARKRDLLTRLEELAAQHHWTPPGSFMQTIEAAKAE